MVLVAALEGVMAPAAPLIAPPMLAPIVEIVEAKIPHLGFNKKEKREK